MMGKAKRVASIAPDGTRTEYKSMLAAARETGANVGNLYRAILSGESCRGMKWVEADGDGKRD